MISIVLPVYNPSAGWADHVVTECLSLRDSMPQEQFEFIIVNDGSTSEHYLHEKSKIETNLIRLIEYGSNQGKGHALRTGVMATRGELVVYTDIDFPYTRQSISDVIDALRSGRADVVIGVKDKDYYHHVPSFRRFASQLLRSFVRVFFRIPTDDFMCGLKGFNQRGKTIFMQTSIDRYLFDLEFMKLLAANPEVKNTTLEIQLRDNIHFRSMNPTLILSELKDLFTILFRSDSKK